MKSTLRWFVILSSAILVMPTMSAFSQWKQIAHDLFRWTGTGAMTYKDGYIWVACDGVYMSGDSGKTWTEMGSLPPYTNGVFYDINFFDVSTGLAASLGGTYITTDQGMTWSLLKAGEPISACFGPTKDIIATSEEANQGVNISTDGGNTWTTALTAYQAYKIRYMRDGSFYTYAGDPYTAVPTNLWGGYIYSSTDMGTSWYRHSGRTQFDSFDFDVDSCDLNHIYIANSNFFGAQDSISRIYVSDDTGNTWNVAIQNTKPYFTGTLAVTTSAVYASSDGNGVYRSIDKGKTWRSIGGPTFMDPDTRFLSAVNDNIVFTCDGFGDVWATFNSGGDSLPAASPYGSYTFTPDSILAFGTQQDCAAPIVDTLIVTRHCAPPTINSVTITGADAAHFYLANASNPDSLVVLFVAGQARQYSATLELTLADGSIDSLPLAGKGVNSPAVTLNLANVSDNIIGDSVFIPIVIEKPDAKTNLSFRVRFDTSVLVYAGTHDTQNKNIDETTQIGAGYARVNFPSATIASGDSLIGYLAFRIFPITDSCSTITVDSIVMASDSLADGTASICQTGATVTAQICMANGCGTSSLSEFLRYGKAPSVSLQPNPSNGLETVHSSVDLGTVHIDVTNALGEEVLSTDAALSPEQSVALNTTGLPTGVYAITIRNASYSTSLKMLNMR